MLVNMLAARQTRIPGRHRQHAVRGYSEGRASPCSFVMHNVANISTAIQAADALKGERPQTILNAASARASSVSRKGTCKVCVYSDFLRGQ
jgi:hypothetical protein